MPNSKPCNINLHLVFKEINANNRKSGPIPFPFSGFKKPQRQYYITKMSHFLYKKYKHFAINILSCLLFGRKQ